MMRLLLLVAFLAGIALAGFPWFSDNFLAREVGTWRVYDSVTGYLPALAQLKSTDATLNVLLDMTTAGAPDLSADRAVATLTVSAGGKTILAKALTFADAKGRDINPQTGEKIFSESAGIIQSRQGPHLFTLGPGDAEGVTVRSVDLILKRNGVAYDPRLQPAGFALTAISFICLVLALRGGREKPPQNPNSQPPPPRWGRGGSQPS